MIPWIGDQLQDNPGSHELNMAGSCDRRSLGHKSAVEESVPSLGVHGLKEDKLVPQKIHEALRHCHSHSEIQIC